MSKLTNASRSVFSQQQDILKNVGNQTILVTFYFQYMFDFFKVPTWGWVNVDRNVFLGEIPLRYKGKGEKNTQIDI